LIPFPKLWLKFRNKYGLRGGVVRSTANPQTGAPGYPVLSRLSPLTCQVWDNLTLSKATASQDHLITQAPTLRQSTNALGGQSSPFTVIISGIPKIHIHYQQQHPHQVTRIISVPGFLTSPMSSATHRLILRNLNTSKTPQQTTCKPRAENHPLFHTFEQFSTTIMSYCTESSKWTYLRDHAVCMYRHLDWLIPYCRSFNMCLTRQSIDQTENLIRSVPQLVKNFPAFYGT